MTHEPKLIGFRIQEKSLGGDDVKLGYFDFTAGGIELSGSMLVRTANAGFAVRMPIIANNGKATIRIIDEPLRHKLTELARKAYIALGGQWGEWAPIGSEERKELDEWLKTSR